MHPTYGDQVIVSYFQGGKICTFIAEKWGYEKLIAMLHDFGNKMTTPEVVEKELQMKPEEFDKQFLAWLEPQTEKTVKNYDEWRKRVRIVAGIREGKEVGRSYQGRRSHPRHVFRVRHDGQRV